MNEQHAPGAVRSLLLAALFCAVLEYTYLALIPATYDAVGSGYRPLGVGDWALNWCFALAPAILLPGRHLRPTSLLVLAQYYAIYAPACLLLAHVTRPVLQMADVRALQQAMLAGMVILLVGHRLPRLAIRRPRLSARAFGIAFACFSAVIIVFLALVLGRNFRITNLEEIYDVRTAAIDASASTPGVLYILGWFASVVVPVAFAVMAAHGRKLLAVVALGGFVFHLGIGGAKTSIIALGLLPVLFLAARRSPTTLPRLIPLGLVGVFAFALLFKLTGPPIISLWYTAVTVERTFAVPTFLLAQYLDFFSNHDLTYFSHVSVINRLVPYPYLGDLSTMLGVYFYGVPVGSNAGMWAGDGIAALGLWGIPFISLVAAGVFWLVDSICLDQDIAISTTSLGLIAMTYTNISLATTLVSGGLLLLMGLAFLAPPAEERGTAVVPPDDTLVTAGA